MQIRAQFQVPDDLTEEEKLEPVRNFGDDPKIRLLNRLYEKKRRVRAACPVAARQMYTLVQSISEKDPTLRSSITSARLCGRCACNSDMGVVTMIWSMLMGILGACQ